MSLTSLHGMFIPSLASCYLSKKEQIHDFGSWRALCKERLEGVQWAFSHWVREEEFVPKTSELWKEKVELWLSLKLGKVNPSEFFDQFSTFNTDGVIKRSSFNHDMVLPFPKGGLGSTLKLFLSQGLYFSFGWGDPNGCKNRVGYDTAFDCREYFRAVEAGYTSGDLGKFYLLAWNQDPLKKKKKPAGYGVVTHVEGAFGRYYPYLRYSYVHGRCFDLTRALSIGLGITNPFNRKKDSLGISGTWGRSFSKIVKDQRTLETFYKYAWSSTLSVTPHFQLNYRPVKYRDAKTETAFGVRLKSSF